MLMRPLRVIIWAVSQSRSTALERCVMEHPAVHVLHERLSEPFLMQHWPEKYRSVLDTRRKTGTRDLVPTYGQALQALAQAPLPDGKSVLLSKEIAWFCDFAQISDDWLQQFKHVFLVREPEAVMRSLYRVGTHGEDTWFDPDESGFEELLALYWRVHRVCPAQSLLALESDSDLMHDSASGLSTLCDFMGVPFNPTMLHWEARTVPAWQFFKGWHEEAQRSTGFAAVHHPEQTYPAVVRECADSAQPTYRFFALLAGLQRPGSTAGMLRSLHRAPSAHLDIVLLHSSSEDLSHLLWSMAQLPNVSCHALDTSASTWTQNRQPSELHELVGQPLLLACTEASATAQRPSIDKLMAQSCVIGLLTETGFHMLDAQGRTGPSSLTAPQACTLQLQRLRERSLDDWGTFNHYNRSAADVPDWLDTFSASVTAEPDHIAVSDGRDSLTLQQLHDQAQRLARVLQARLAPDAWAVLFKRKNIHTAVAMTACALAGRRYLEIPAWYSAQHCQQLLERLGECLVLCDADGARQLEAAQPYLLESQFARQVPADCPPWARTRPAIAYGLLTSGTSGPAKVALMSPSAMLDSLHLWQNYLQPGQRVGFNAWLTSYLYYPLLSRCTTVIIADEVVLDPIRLMDFIVDNQLQQIMITPSLLQGLVREEIRFVACCAGLRLLWSSGEKLSAALRSQVQALLPDCHLLDLYGSNEAGDVALKHDDGTLQLIRGVQAQVLDREGQAVPLRVAGQLHLRTPGLFSGYLGQADTAAVNGRLFDSGDRVICLGNGRLQLLGRDSAHLKIRGYKVHPENVEQVLNNHPLVAQSYIGSRHEGAARQLLAYVVPADPAQLPTATALRAWAALNLPFFAVPSAYYAVASLDAGRNQKRERLSAAHLDQAVPLPEDQVTLTATQAQVSTVWRMVLGDDIPALHEDDDFFDRGGSLQLSELLLELNNRFDVQLSLSALLRDTRLQGMALAIDRAQAGLPAVSILREVAVEAARYPFSPGPQRGEDLIHAYRAKPRKRILLTGATGFFGAFILATLARQPEVEHVICLVRATDLAEARRRCLDSLHRHGLVPPGVPLDWLSKLQMECGDLTTAHLGLAADTYRHLTETVDCVVHAGAEVNWVKPYANLVPCNVEGTAQIVQLALDGAMPLLLVSTLAGGGSARTGYEESKQVAEAMALNAAREHGLPVTIARCGDLAAPLEVAHSVVNDSDYVCLLLGTCMLLGCWPDLEGSVNLTPVDVAAQVMTQLAIQVPASATSRASNLCHPHGALDWRTLCGWVADNLEPGSFVPLSLDRWRRCLDHDTRQHPTIAKTRLILSMILDDLLATPPRNDLEFPRTSAIRLNPQWAARLTRQLLRTLEQARS